MSSTNDLLTATMGGAAQDYEGIIANMVSRHMGLNRQSAKFDDVVTDITSDLVIAAQEGGLQLAIAKAKANSSDDETLAKNMKSVFMTGVWYRIQTAIRNKKRKTITFSEIEAIAKSDSAKESDKLLFDVLAVDKKRGNEEHEYRSYGQMIMDELETMALASEWGNKTRLAKRYRLAKQMVPGKLAGKTMTELRDEFAVKSLATMQAIFDDMAKATAWVASKTQNEILLFGTASVEAA